MRPLWINRKRVVVVLVAISLALALASLSVNLCGYWLHSDDVPFDHILDVAQDGNIPTHYSALILAIAAVLLWTIGSSVGAEGGQRSRPWKALSVIFLYLSMDEAAQLHETARLFHPSWLPDWGILYWPWVIFGAAAVIVIGVASIRFLGDLPRDTRRLFLIAGATYVGGALGLELIGALLVQADPEGLALIIEETLEETLEMLGVVLFIHALLSYIASHMPTIQVQVGAGPPEREMVGDGVGRGAARP